ncbi:unnamed protein product [Tilletia laevis]|uniref:Amidase domain-containing protein n=3 Tax=Tilletia TaxID=13289 RepID=A0A8X7MP24_9BASI|nr:hypothetical protein CF328_g5364 [Tilletia controversa]KAE8199921.1 hypothetical protein CF336_g978 [Tilletia laevis]KAE8256977.1 hypothetical protein A4X03_0g4868 [Tilletia caries]KAE8208346.1 hypothetical protein CF335_g486 [Tilletia laevis]KAE8243579.1 hypothetical protein A4X06_0g6222 [Tilletia controversa]
MIFGSRSIAQAKRDHLAARDAALLRPLSIDPHKDDLLAVGDARDHEILASGVSALTKGIEERKWTATDVLAAYIRSSRRAQERLNCLTEILFESAIEKAKSLDDYFEREGKLIGPLHGVPLSLKDHLPTVGSKVTLGFSSWIKNPPAAQNATIVNVLEHLGAVPFVRTHIPQTMIAFECQTPLFGTTKNPINTKHTPGGSSGGEAALLVADGSPMGVGSDIGGSLRIPAAYSGCYSLKPSEGRWTKAGSANFGSGFYGIYSVFGPMARTAADIELIFNAVVNVLQPPSVGSIDMESADGGEAITKAVQYEALMNKLNYLDLPPAALRPGWNAPLALAKARGKPLRIGIIYTDGFIKTSPACYRAVFESVDAIKRKHGSEVELVRVPAAKVRSAEGLQIFTAILGAAGHYDKTKHITAPDGLIRPILMVVYLTRMPGFVYRIIAFICKWVLRDRRLAMIMKAPGQKSALEYQRWVAKKQDFIGEWREQVWDGMGLDGIIAPVHAVPALHHNGTADLSMLAAGTTLYNVMDNAVATIPVTRVDADLDSHLPPTKRGPKVQQAWNRWSKDKELQSEQSHVVSYNIYGRGRYDAKRMHGLSVGVQMICRPHAEETALGLMRLLDDALPSLAERGGSWNVDGDASRPARGFGPGSYTTAVYGGSV